MNAFDSTYLDWVETGSSPYLNAQDQPTNKVSLNTGFDKKEGIWNFVNSGAESSETISQVYLEVYQLGSEDFDFGLPSLAVVYWDGAAWRTIYIASTSAWGWRSSANLAAFLNTWAKIDGCKAYFNQSLAGTQTIEVDCMRIKVVTSVAAAQTLKRMVVGIGL